MHLSTFFARKGTAYSNLPATIYYVTIKKSSAYMSILCIALLLQWFGLFHGPLSGGYILDKVLKILVLDAENHIFQDEIDNYKYNFLGNMNTFVAVIIPVLL